MNDQVWLALLACVASVSTTVGSVVLAYLKLREGQRTVIRQTNGALDTERQRVTDAHRALAAAGVDIPPDHAPAESAA